MCLFSLRRERSPTRARDSDNGTSQPKEPGATASPRYTSVSPIPSISTSAWQPTMYSGLAPFPSPTLPTRGEPKPLAMIRRLASYLPAGDPRPGVYGDTGPERWISMTFSPRM